MTPKVAYTVTVSPQAIGRVGRTGGAADGATVPLQSTVKAMSPAARLLYHVVRMPITSPAFVDIVTSSLEPLPPHAVEAPAESSYLQS